MPEKRDGCYALLSARAKIPIFRDCPIKRIARPLRYKLTQSQSANMEKVGIFFGSSTGNTESAAEAIKGLLGNAELFNVADTKAAKMAEFTNLIIGTSTWGVGDLQDDMEGFVSDMASVDLKGKKVALFGLGDQSSYGDTYCDGMGKVYQALQGKGCDVIGFMPTAGYEFDASVAVDGGEFVGLALDADNQGEKTDERIKTWVAKIQKEFK